jgi:hypothetical protein
MTRELTHSSHVFSKYKMNNYAENWDVEYITEGCPKQMFEEQSA